MHKSLEDIAQRIDKVFSDEKSVNRYNFSKKYSSTFDDFVYEAIMNNANLSLHDVAKQLSKPLFIYNNNKSELVVISPIFALLFGLNEGTTFESLKLNDWFNGDFWTKNLPKDPDQIPNLKYQNMLGDIPEFMGYLKVQDNDLAINVLRCKHLFNLDADKTFLVNDLPNIFKLQHSDPIHLVRFLTSQQIDN